MLALKFSVFDENGISIGKAFHFYVTMGDAGADALRLAVFIEAHALWVIDDKSRPGEYGYFPYCREAHVFEINDHVKIPDQMMTEMMTEMMMTEMLTCDELLQRVSKRERSLHFGIVRWKQRTLLVSTSANFPLPDVPSEVIKTHTVAFITEMVKRGIRDLARLIIINGHLEPGAEPPRIQANKTFLDDPVLDFAFEHFTREINAPMALINMDSLTKLTKVAEALLLRVREGAGKMSDLERTTTRDCFIILVKALKFCMLLPLGPGGNYENITQGVCAGNTNLGWRPSMVHASNNDSLLQVLTRRSPSAQPSTAAPVSLKRSRDWEHGRGMI